VNSEQIHSSKTDFSGVDIRADPFQQFVDKMKHIRFLSSSKEVEGFGLATSGGKSKGGETVKSAITKVMMYEFLYATRTVSVEHGQTQKYEK
jgi:hypothetical protein